MRDRDDGVRRFAAEALGQSKSSAGVPVLVKALADPAAGVRGAAEGALEQVGESAVPALVAALHNGPLTTRRSAAAVLGRIARTCERLRRFWMCCAAMSATVRSICRPRRRLEKSPCGIRCLSCAKRCRCCAVWPPGRSSTRKLCAELKPRRPGPETCRFLPRRLPLRQEQITCRSPPLPRSCPSKRCRSLPRRSLRQPPMAGKASGSGFDFGDRPRDDAPCH